MQRVHFEIGGVLLTAFGHVALVPNKVLHGVFVGVAVLGWLVWLGVTAVRDREQMRTWGFRFDNAREAGIPATAVAVLTAVVLVGYGLANGINRMSGIAALGFVLYPIWGIIQQYLIQALLAANLRDRLGVVATVLVTAGAFGAVHYPYPALMVATFLMGLAWTPIYLKSPNLWFIGVYHGWLGTLLYAFVLNRSPLEEMLG